MLYDTKSGSISYNIKKSLYTLTFKDQEYSMHFCEFINVYRKINSINFDVCLLSTDSKYDTNKLVLFRSNKILKLSLLEMVQVKDLFEGAMFSLKLRDLLYRSTTQTTIPLHPEHVFA